MTDKDRHERYHIADSGYEVEVVAKLTGLSRLQAFNLIEKHGRNRANLVREAKMLKDRQTASDAIDGTESGKNERYLPRGAGAPIVSAGLD